MNRTVLIGAAGLAAVVLGVVVFTSGSSSDGPAVGVASAEPATSASAATAANDEAIKAQRAKGYAIGDVVLGDPNAPVKIVEYASLTCGFCAKFHAETLPTIKKDYIETGKAQLIIREIYFQDIGVFASSLARCGGSERFHAFIDVILTRQAFFTTPDAEANRAELRRIGRLGGLTKPQIDACLTDTEYQRTLFDISTRLAAEDKVRSTPYIFVGDEVVRGAVDASTLAKIIDAELAEKGAE